MMVALASFAQASPTTAAVTNQAVIKETPVVRVAPVMARFDGYGTLHFGMSVKQVDQARAGQLSGAPTAGSSCFSKRPLWVKSPGDPAFMFEKGHFQRYDVALAKEFAPGGGRVGTSAAQIRHTYGAGVDEQPHKYVVGANYLRVKAPQGSAVLVFENDAAGKVMRWHVGMPPQINYVEGCA